MRDVQRASFAYRYRDVPTLKNPFDLALYMMLLSRLRPRTIVEIGSAAGGSALWFAAQCRALDLRSHIISLDLQPPDLVDSDVTFIAGNVMQLERSALPGLLTHCARPLMVVEDGPHTFDGSLAALEFFDDQLRSGEYIVIEDGIVKDLGFRSLRNGPHRAIERFMSDHPGQYEVDRELCDFYGRNVTWNPNGYLRRC